MKLDWLVPRENRPKQQVKLVLNMLLMAMAGVPRGGTVSISADGDAFTARAQGDGPRCRKPSPRSSTGRPNSACWMRDGYSPITQSCWRSRPD